MSRCSAASDNLTLFADVVYYTCTKNIYALTSEAKMGRTIIMTLQDAVETQLKDIEKLGKQDNVIFLYLKGKDNISIAVHNALSYLNCHTEFFEIPDETANKSDMLIYLAYLAGSNKGTGAQPGAAIIDTQNACGKLAFLNIPMYSSFSDFLNGKQKSEKKTEQVQRERKPRSTKTPKSIGKSNPAIEQETEEKPKQAESPAKTTKGTTTAKAKPATQKVTMETFKDFLKTLATDEYDPSADASSIYYSLEASILQNVGIQAALKGTLILEDRVNVVNKALNGEWDKTRKMVEDMLRERGKIK